MYEKRIEETRCGVATLELVVVLGLKKSSAVFGCLHSAS